MHTRTLREQRVHEMRAKKAQIVASAAKKMEKKKVKEKNDRAGMDSMTVQNVSLFIPEFNHSFSPMSMPARPPSLSKTGERLRKKFAANEGKAVEGEIGDPVRIAFPMEDRAASEVKVKVAIPVEVDERLPPPHSPSPSVRTSHPPDFPPPTSEQGQVGEEEGDGTVISATLEGPSLFAALPWMKEAQTARPRTAPQPMAVSSQPPPPQLDVITPVHGISRALRRADTLFGSTPRSATVSVSTAFSAAAAQDFAFSDPLSSPSPVGVKVVEASVRSPSPSSRGRLSTSPQLTVRQRQDGGRRPPSLRTPRLIATAPLLGSARTLSARPSFSTGHTRPATVRGGEGERGEKGERERESNDEEEGGRAVSSMAQLHLADGSILKRRDEGGMRGGMSRSSHVSIVGEGEGEREGEIDEGGEGWSEDKASSAAEHAVPSHSDVEEEDGREIQRQSPVRSVKSWKGSVKEEGSTADASQRSPPAGSGVASAGNAARSPSPSKRSTCSSPALQKSYSDFVDEKRVSSPSKEEGWLEKQLSPRQRASLGLASPSLPDSPRESVNTFSLYDESESSSDEEDEVELVDEDGIDEWRGLTIHASTAKDLQLNRKERIEKMRAEREKKMLYMRMKEEVQKQKDRKKAGQKAQLSEEEVRQMLKAYEETQQYVIGKLWRDKPRLPPPSALESLSPPKKRRARPPEPPKAQFTAQSADRLCVPRLPGFSDAAKEAIRRDEYRRASRTIAISISTPFKKQVEAGGKTFGVRPGDSPRVQERISDLQSNGYAREQLRKKAAELRSDILKEKQAELAAAVNFMQENRRASIIEQHKAEKRVEMIRDRFVVAEARRREKLERLLQREHDQQEERERLSLQRMRELDTAREMSRREPYVDNVRKKLLVTIFFHARIATMADKLRKWRLAKIHLSQLQRAVVLVQRRWRQKATDVTLSMRIKAMKIFRRNFWKFEMKCRLKRKARAAGIIRQLLADIKKSSSAVTLIRSFHYKIKLIQRRFRDLQAIRYTRLSLITTQFDKVDKERVAELEKVWKTLMQKEKDLQSQVAKREVERGRSMRSMSSASGGSGKSLMDTRLRKQQMNLAKEIDKLPRDVKKIPKVRPAFRTKLAHELLDYLKQRQAERLVEYEAVLKSVDENKRVKDIIMDTLPKEALEARPDLIPPDIVIPPYPNFLIRIPRHVLEEAVERACADAREHDSYYRRVAGTGGIRRRQYSTSTSASTANAGPRVAEVESWDTLREDSTPSGGGGDTDGEEEE